MIASTPRLRNSTQTASFAVTGANHNLIQELLHLALGDGEYLSFVKMHALNSVYISVCPGKDVAENTVWVALTSIFYAFKVTPARDENGTEIPIDLEYKENSVRYVTI
jgi:hypothetical protein